MLCVRECPSVVWKNIDGIPRADAPDDCNLCSHCLAVCPQDAIVHEGLDPAQIIKIDSALIILEAYETIVKGRRSVRHYKGRQVPGELIEKLIRLVSHTPTATNSQNVEYIVVTDKTRINTIARSVFNFAVKVFYFTQKFPGNLIYKWIKLFPASQIVTRYLDPMPYYIEETDKGRDFILHNAPALILIHGPKGGNFSNENCNLAAGNLMNYAYASGLGSCYIGFLNIALKYSRKLRSMIQLPASRMVYASIVVGYPSYRYTNTASRQTPVIRRL